MLYGIAKEFIFNLALLAMFWSWGIGILDFTDGLTTYMLTPTGWGEGEESEEGNTCNTLLLTGFVRTFMARGSTDIEISDVFSLILWETKEFSFEEVELEWSTFLSYGFQLFLLEFGFLDFIIQVNDEDSIQIIFRGNICNIC